MENFRSLNHSCDTNISQIFFLEELLSSQELRNQFFISANRLSSNYEIGLSEEVMAILNNSALFDERLSYKIENFWITDLTSISIPIIYRADPTLTAFALGTLVGHIMLGGAVAGGAAVATSAVKKK